MASPQHIPAPVKKRIIVCCDGTWQDGVVRKYRWQYTNIIKISRLLNHQDSRHDPPIPQVVFYQSGVGTTHNIIAEYVEGATGASLSEKVQEAYAFIAHNYQSGDEIFLFGFSRGAYTARMVAAFVGEIGVLDKKDMDSFADIFIAYQQRGNASSEKEKAEQNEALQKWEPVMANGRKRANLSGDGFAIKCVGVFDTVGAVGLPEELTFFSKKFKQLFGFQDKRLGSHIHYAFHAMAINETRADFDVAKFEQTPEGREKGQILKQVWFAGSHSDIGGGWRAHDLSDLTLAWMVSLFKDMLAVDSEYLCTLPKPVAEWGKQVPHDPATGIFKLALETQRALPKETNDVTHEYIHASVLEQTLETPQLLDTIKANPAMVVELSELEQRFKREWPSIPKQLAANNEETKAEDETERKSQQSMQKTLEKMVANAEKSEVMVDEGGRPRYNESWIGSIIHSLLGSK